MEDHGAVYETRTLKMREQIEAMKQIWTKDTARVSRPDRRFPTDAELAETGTAAVPLTTQHYPMLQRNLVYTGVTRGKRLVVLVGQRKALAIAVKGSRARRRWSKLREWLIGGDRLSRSGPRVD